MCDDGSAIASNRTGTSETTLRLHLAALCRGFLKNGNTCFVLEDDIARLISDGDHAFEHMSDAFDAALRLG